MFLGVFRCSAWVHSMLTVKKEKLLSDTYVSLDGQSSPKFIEYAYVENTISGE